MTLQGAITFWTNTLTKLREMASGGALKPESPTSGKVLELFRERASADVSSYFNSSTNPEGAPWNPLKWRVGKPLILTGALMAASVSAFRRAEYQGPGHIVVHTAGLPHYWQYQNYGTKRIPRRWFFYVRPATLETFAKMVADGIGYEIVHHTQARN